MTKVSKAHSGHETDPDFWPLLTALPKVVQLSAFKNYKLLKANPRHPSLQFKKIRADLWSARVANGYRALAYPGEVGFVWFWIGPHTDYERLIKGR